MGCACHRGKVSEPTKQGAPAYTTTLPTGDLRIQAGAFVGKREGSVRSHYHIGAKLGSGAFGNVRLVTHRVSGHRRAMKSIEKRHISSHHKQRLQDEIEILRLMDHPNIVRVYEYFEDERVFHIIAEFVEGGELFDYIIRSQRFSESTAANFMKQVLSAVGYCHSKGIVHRDLKPENLLLDRDAPDATLKVIDFGTSAVMEDSQVLTQKFGTAYYIAPEVLAQSYNEKCDVWSLGVILFIMLSGRPPFYGKNDDEIFQRILKGHFSMRGPEWEHVSSGAKLLITKMLDPNYRTRLSACEALRDEWIQTNAAVVTHDPEQALVVLNNLQSFRAEQRLQHAVLTFIGSQLVTREESKKLAESFKELDINGDGKLSREELLEAYTKQVGPEQAAEEVEKIMRQVDIDNSGYIDYTEFLIASSQKEQLLSKKNLEAAFRMFDQDGSGKISAHELKDVFQGIAHAVDQQCWSDIVSEVDANNDGEIDIHEFSEVMQRLFK